MFNLCLPITVWVVVAKTWGVNVYTERPLTWLAHKLCDPPDGRRTLYTWIPGGHFRPFAVGGFARLLGRKRADFFPPQWRRLPFPPLCLIWAGPATGGSDFRIFFFLLLQWSGAGTSDLAVRAQRVGLPTGAAGEGETTSQSGGQCKRQNCRYRGWHYWRRGWLCHGCRTSPLQRCLQGWFSPPFFN